MADFNLGTDNTISWDGVTSTNNGEEGFEIDGSDNKVTIFESQLINNATYGLNIGGDNNMISLGNTKACFKTITTRG